MSGAAIGTLSSGERVRGMHLHVDGVSGIAGDMTLAALIDLGVPVEVIGDALDAVGAGRGRLRVARVVKRGIAAVDVKVETGEGQGLRQGHRHDGDGHSHAHAPVHDHGESLADRRDHKHVHGHSHGHSHGQDEQHGHGHGDHAHHHYADIRARIVAAPLVPEARRRALDIFDRLARAEAQMHGTSVDDVQFHEVGAIDAIVDIVGTAAALAWLAPRSVSCGAVAMGSGSLTCAHGKLPVPAPAALAILTACGGLMTDGGVARELCTPTGAAILAGTVTSWTAPPTGTPLASGWGAGDVDLTDRANVVRVTAIDPVASVSASGSASASASASDLWQLDANIDDMNPEWCGPALDAVLAAGALDAWWTPIVMKKGRPALTLAALVTGDTRAAVIAAILRETTTIGLRFHRVERQVLARRLVVVATPYGPIEVKLAHDAAGALANLAPEHDACARAAATHGVALKLVYAAALAAAASLVDAAGAPRGA